MNMFRKIAYVLSISLILLVPFIYSHELYNGVVSAKQIWFYGTIALLMLITGIDITFNIRLIAFNLNAIDIALLAFYAFYFIRATTTPYIPLTHNQKFINWTLLVIMYFLIKIIIKENLKIMKKEDNSIAHATSFFEYSSLIIHLLVLLALVQAIWGLLQFYDILPRFQDTFKIIGTFYNPAPYAFYLALIFPLALVNVLLNDENNKKNYSLFSQIFTNRLSFITVFTILLVLPLTMIRAAWIAVIAGSLIVLNYKYNFIQKLNRFLKTRTRKLIIMIIALVVIASLSIGLYHLKKDSSVGKLFIWEVTIGKIAERPLFGYGIGRFEAEYNNWQSEYFRKHPKEINGPKGMAAGNTIYAFNEFLEMTAEIGIIGLLLFLILIILIMKHLSNKNNEKIIEYSSQLYFIVFYSFFISFISLLIISFPFYSIPTLILFFFILASLSSLQNPLLIISNDSYFITCLGRLRGVILIVVSLYMFSYTFFQYNAYSSWGKADKLYKMRNISEAYKLFIDSNRQLMYNGNFIVNYGNILYKNKDYKNGISKLNEARKLSSDELLFLTLGNCYKELKQYSKAEWAYKHASLMSPNKFYPLYLLAKMYDESGQSQKAILIARQILDKKIKIKSEAID
jgi:O-antigen polymerase